MREEARCVAVNAFQAEMLAKSKFMCVCGVCSDVVDAYAVIVTTSIHYFYFYSHDHSV